MEVILKEDVPQLGSAGEVVKVAEGYGRNYLLPRKLAIEATKANKAVIEQMKAAAVRRAAREKGNAEAQAKLLENVALVFVRRAGEQEQLFGSVTSADIAAELEKRGLPIERRKILLDHPLKTVGEFAVTIYLHKEVKPAIKVSVQTETGPAGVAAAPEAATEAATESASAAAPEAAADAAPEAAESTTEAEA
jgi:large subunit ribosomal protein L9